MSKYRGFSSPNSGNNGPEKTPYLDTFHAVEKSECTKFQEKKQILRYHL